MVGYSYGLGDGVYFDWNDPVTTIHKCQCGHPTCKQYTLSTQGGVGFSLEDATLYAAADTMLDALEAVKAEGSFNHSTRCRDWWPQVLAAIAKAKGENQ